MAKNRTFRSEVELKEEIDNKLEQYEKDAAELTYDEIQEIRDKIYAEEEEKENGFIYIVHLQLVLKEIETIHKKVISRQRNKNLYAYKQAVKKQVDKVIEEINDQFHDCKRNLMQFQWTDPYTEIMLDTNATDRLGLIALLTRYDVDKYINPFYLNIPKFWDSVQINYAIKKFMSEHKHNDTLEKIYFADSYETWCKDICKRCIMLYKPHYGKSFYNFYLLVLEHEYQSLMRKYKMVSTKEHEAKVKLPIFVDIEHLKGGFKNKVEIEIDRTQQINEIDKIDDKIDLKRFISTLTERQQQIVTLKLQDLTQEQIASRLNVSTKTIKREYKVLKELFKKYFSV